MGWPSALDGRERDERMYEELLLRGRLGLGGLSEVEVDERWGARADKRRMSEKLIFSHIAGWSSCDDRR